MHYQYNLKRYPENRIFHKSNRSPTVFSYRGLNQFLSRFTFIRISISHQFSILSKRFSIIIFRHHAHTPDTCSVALEVRPRTCENSTNTKYSIRLFLRWSITIAILVVATVVSTGFIISHLRHRFTKISSMITRYKINLNK